MLAIEVFTHECLTRNRASLQRFSLGEALDDAAGERASVVGLDVDPASAVSEELHGFTSRAQNHRTANR